MINGWLEDEWTNRRSRLYLKCCFPESLSETFPAPQNKYKEEGKKEMSSSLYSQLPETSEMQLAKAVHEFQSEVLKHEFRSDFSSSCVSTYFIS